MNEQEIQKKAEKYVESADSMQFNDDGGRLNMEDGYVAGYKQALADIQKQHEEAIEEMDKWIEGRKAWSEDGWPQNNDWGK